ncbi:succinate dehydrogenase subunit D [Faunimonas pinastri]|uniref:Succinate dehydrogenase hydrophobic membrane anchor subunit n=1 Tax=Faunimonas pinastri TaxID=1855383 RepID=A0A1H9MBJ2_9HYPH|nr:succinate dehydrogenase, hydrophobic membrane anchor protein [Faunimonas pinastri]SER20971.1 succinate dehydrogenase subunit D [Faunimonas pinastri]
MTMRTSLGQVRGRGTAGQGTAHFMVQRFTAIANVFLVIAFIVLIVSLTGKPYVEVRATLASPLPALIILALMLSVANHMRLGMQVVLEDYIHGDLSKIIAIALNNLYAAAIGIVCIFAILKIAFGG